MSKEGRSTDLRQVWKTEHQPGLLDWIIQNQENNEDQMDRLRRNLSVALKEELTPRQQEILSLKFLQQKSVTQIANELGIHKSSVSRTLHRALKRLERSVKYAF